MALKWPIIHHFAAANMSRAIVKSPFQCPSDCISNHIIQLDLQFAPERLYGAKTTRSRGGARQFGISQRRAWRRALSAHSRRIHRDDHVRQIEGRQQASDRARAREGAFDQSDDGRARLSRACAARFCCCTSRQRVIRQQGRPRQPQRPRPASSGTVNRSRRDQQPPVRACARAGRHRVHRQLPHGRAIRRRHFRAVLERVARAGRRRFLSL